MKILVTGAKGFVGKNLCAALNNIKDGKDRRFPNLAIEAVFEYDIDSTPEELDQYCREADFVFNLAGVNRPKEQSEFMAGNFGFASTLLSNLRKYGNTCPVMLSSSIQATLAGRFGTSEYGKSKKAGEKLFFDYSKETGAKVLVYRFPNLFGKWCRPNYNSAVATFCNAFANDLPYTVNDSSVELELLYIDDLVDEMLDALQGKEHHCEFDGVETIYKEDGRYCAATITHKVTLGEIVELLKEFEEQPKTLMIPEIPAGSFAKKLYSTYLSYLPKEKAAFALKMNVDERGSFTELVHTHNAGQVSINISKPGITKGQHWHNTKFEQFIVVKGHGLIQQRNLNDPEGKVLEWEVSGDKIEAVHMLPGYTHNIINLSDTEDLVTVMYCNEVFDPNKPDTFFDPVAPQK
jgi:UDP-2-acetamido-2,6-beta-L-arabino-hexul-4-ose reductase